MVTQIKKQRATYRIVIYDLEKHKSKTISLFTDDGSDDFEEVYQKVKSILE